ncbi:RcnB family protein [Pseudomonas sp. SDO528_S397]
MKSKSLIACLLLAASCFTVSLTAQAAQTPDQTVQPSNINQRDLTVGDRAPDILARKESAITDWKKRGLKQPDDDAQWAQVNGKYVMVKITNGTILEITPVKK